ncbi:hypothetical protein ACUXQ2_002207 [Cupriavidus metallidurans]
MNGMNLQGSRCPNEQLDPIAQPVSNKAKHILANAFIRILPEYSYSVALHPTSSSPQLKHI